MEAKITVYSQLWFPPFRSHPFWFPKWEKWTRQQWTTARGSWCLTKEWENFWGERPWNARDLKDQRCDKNLSFSRAALTSLPPFLSHKSFRGGEEILPYQISRFGSYLERCPSQSNILIRQRFGGLLRKGEGGRMISSSPSYTLLQTHAGFLPVFLPVFLPNFNCIYPCPGPGHSIFSLQAIVLQLFTNFLSRKKIQPA